MKFAIKALIGFWILLLAVGYFLPQEYEIKRTTVIESDMASVHHFTKDLTMWQQWQPWVESDPSIRFTLSSITQGVGATQSWSSDSGDGKLTFTAVAPWGIEYNLSLNSGATQAISSLTYKELSANQTEVTWWMKSQLNTPIFGGYLAFFMDGMIGDSFDSGLSKLKQLVESSSGR